MLQTSKNVRKSGDFFDIVSALKFVGLSEVQKDQWKLKEGKNGWCATKLTERGRCSYVENC